MFLSVFDLFKIGIGPSSSHTMGPMVAAKRFVDLAEAQDVSAATRLTATLHGSLAFTGKGHGTDRAIVLGLAGESPQDIDPDDVETILIKMNEVRIGDRSFAFDQTKDIIFDFGPALKGHANGLVFRLHDGTGNILLEETYYSIGGGFVMTAAERTGSNHAPSKRIVPHPFKSAMQMLEMGKTSGLTIAQMKRANEITGLTEVELNNGLDHIWSTMNA